MNGETYQAAHLVLCAGNAMKTKMPFHFEAERFVQSVVFQSDLYTKQNEREQSAPEEWFAAQIAKGMTDIFLLLQTETTDRDRKLMAFANAHPCVIVTKYGGRTTFWKSTWSFDQEKKAWGMYSGRKKIGRGLQKDGRKSATIRRNFIGFCLI